MILLTTLSKETSERCSRLGESQWDAQLGGIPHSNFLLNDFGIRRTRPSAKQQNNAEKSIFSWLFTLEINKHIYSKEIFQEFFKEFEYKLYYIEMHYSSTAVLNFLTYLDLKCRQVTPRLPIDSSFMKTNFWQNFVYFNFSVSLRLTILLGTRGNLGKSRKCRKFGEDRRSKSGLIIIFRLNFFLENFQIEIYYK